ncbi:hypothetical protein [Clostridium thermarum]|uniref:hypothetical protein n=1 Tax=Clostridium thermarum TaxID=1716543 RepID=UPI0013D4E47C|nr:hypothetical protein [Clostridium thermarum]
MTINKQIQEKFRQNDFVLELKPEERYFYMYLITNTITTLCGIYRFSIKLAELETGLAPEVIEKHLRTFESYGKVIVSKATKEIMIVNWFKHNFKGNKRTIASINNELKDVKDKEFLKQLYDICVQRQYPVEDLFKGIIIASTDKEESKIVGQALPAEAQPQEKPVEEALQGGFKKEKEPVKMLFTKLEEASPAPSAKKRKQKTKEDIEVEGIDITFEDDEGQPFIGTAVASWSFVDVNSA